MSIIKQLPSKSTLAAKWRANLLSIIRLSHPSLGDDEIEKELNKLFDKHLVDTDVMLLDNYKQEEYPTTLLNLTEWYFKEKPVTTQSGTFFREPSTVHDPNAQMLRKFKANRKKNKAQMFQFEKGSYEYRAKDREQNSDKVDMNGFYGASGNRASIFYNLHVAMSITLKGQALISTAAMAFENFLTNNVKFMNLDEAIEYINNIVNENYDKRIIETVPVVKITHETIDILLEHLLGKFKYTDNLDNHGHTLKNILMNLSVTDLTRIYYKNNLYAFLNNQYMIDQLQAMVNKLNACNTVFVDPNEAPEIVEHDVDMVWSILREFVFYNHQIPERIMRLKHEPRKCVIVIDTDSNIVHLDPWVKYTEHILSYEKTTENRYNVLNIMGYLLSEMIYETFDKYVEECNVFTEEYKRLIHMKNEFLFSRILLTSSKKNYASLCEMQEGKLVKGGAGLLDVKGLAIKKSTLNPTSRKILERILEEKVIRAPHIQMHEVFKDLYDYEIQIRESLIRGERTYMKPLSVKDMGAYKEPYQNQGVRAAIAWNAVYPEKEIRLPDKFDIVKMNLETLQDLEKLAVTHKEVASLLYKEIFQDPELKKYGVNVFAIPRDIDNIPEWIIPFIDYETIISDNVTNFSRIIESLGAKTLSKDSTERPSNILSFY